MSIERNGKPRFRNRERSVARGAAAAAALLLALCFAPRLLGMDMMRVGYGLIMVSGFLSLCAAITMVVFGRRAARLDALVHGKDLLAHWTYPLDQWREFVELDYREERRAKNALFLVIAAFSLVIGLAFLLFAREGGKAVFLTLMAVVALLSVFAYLLPWRSYVRRVRAPGDVFLAPTACYIAGAFHAWDMLGARIEGVQFKSKPTPILEIGYSAPDNTGRQECTLRVPVPAGEEAVAEEAVKAILAEAARRTV